MQPVTISGASDDLVHIDGCDGEDEFNVLSASNQGNVATFQIYSKIEGAGFLIHAIYDGCWSFAIGQTGEDDPVPDHWEIKMEWSGYTQTVTIMVPDDARVFQEEP